MMAGDYYVAHSRSASGGPPRFLPYPIISTLARGDEGGHGLSAKKAAP
jgi:hypothetical protein